MAAASGEASAGAVMVPRYGWYLCVMELTASNTASCTIAAYRAWANGFWLFATAVLTAIAFQSKTTSALAAGSEQETHHQPAYEPENFLSYICFFIVVLRAIGVRVSGMIACGLACP